MASNPPGIRLSTNRPVFRQTLGPILRNVLPANFLVVLDAAL